MAESESITEKNSIVNWLNRKRSFAVLLIFQCVVLGFILLICSIKYEVSDDFLIELILSGGFTGTPDWHLMFSNPILGLFLYPFYLINPSVSWYFILQLILCFASYISISWVLSDKNNKIIAIVVTIILTMATAGDLYILPQFTKTAAAAIISGSLLFLHGRFSENKILPSIFGALLVIFGSFLRFSVLYSVCLFVFVAVMIFAIKTIREDSNKLKWVLHKLLPTLLLVCVVFGLDSIGNTLFLKGDGYDYYWLYNSARSTIVDYSYSDYYEFGDELKIINISENDYVLLDNWNFGDSTKYSLENMQRIADVLNKHRRYSKISIYDIINYIKERKFKEYPLIWQILLLGIICIVGNWRKSWVPVLCALLVVFYVVLFYYLGRSVYRVEFGFLFAAGVIIAWVTDKTIPLSNPKIWSIVGCLLTAIVVIINLTIWLPRSAGNSSGAICRENIQKYLYWSADYKKEKYSVYLDYGIVYGDFIKLAEDNPQNIYMMEFSTTIQTLYFNFPPFESGALKLPENLFWTGGIATGYPSINKWLEKHGYSDTFRALLEKNVYYVGNWWTENILTFFHENGYPDATVEYVETIDGYEIYKFYQ